MAYFDIKDDYKKFKDNSDKDNQELINKIESTITDKSEKQRDRDEEFIKNIEEIRGNIRLLLDRTQNVRSQTDNNNLSPTINKNTPTNGNIPVKSH